MTPFGLSELSYEAVLREISDVLPRASMSIRSSVGPTIKSCISHTLTRDTRDDAFAPTQGSFVRFKQEYAGLGGDAHFFKTESESTWSRSLSSIIAGPLPRDCILSLGTRTGFLQPLTRDRSSLFVDRYHLGGPTSLRQFKPNSLGPRDAADYLGGDAYWTAGVSLLTPFYPRRQWQHLHLHTFVNAGKLTSFDKERGSWATLKDLVKEPSLSVGFGLMYRHSLVRIEGNVGVPLAMAKQEGGIKGLQFGLGLSFL